MATYNLRGTEGEVSDNLISVLDAEIKKADDMAAEIEALKAERDELSARVNKLEEDHAKMMAQPEADMHGKKDKDKDKEEEKMEGDTADLSAKVEAMVQERLTLIDQSRSILPTSYSFAGKLPAEIRADAVTAAIPSVDLTGMTEEQIKGAYLVALNAPSQPSASTKTLAEATRGDSKKKEPSAREKALSWYNNPAKRGNTKEG